MFYLNKLLEKTRKINSLLQTAAKFVCFSEVASVLGEIIKCNIYITNKKGKILGHNFLIEEKLIEDGSFYEEFNKELLKIQESEYILNDSLFPDENLLIVPIKGGKDRLGTLVLIKAKFNEHDLFLAEYGATVVGMKLLIKNQEKINEESRKRMSVIIALNTLTFTERESMEYIFEELAEGEGILIASKIADKVGITRSTVVNSLRKLASARIVETKSLGMKGTYIKVLNEYFLDNLK